MTEEIKPAPDSGATERYSHDSERLLISVMLNPERANLHLLIVALVSFEDFYVDQHKTAWRIIIAMREAGITPDPIALMDHARTHGEYIGGAQYIIETAQDPVARMCSDESVTGAMNRIKGFSMSRQLERALKMALTLTQAGQPFDQVSSYIDDEVVNLKRLSESSRTGPVKADHFYDQIVAKVQAKLDGVVVESGIPTGFPELDRLMGGQLPNEGLIVIAGRPGMGKTAFATAVEQNISNSGIPTLFFSLEMTGVALAERNLSRHSRIKFSHIKSAEINDHEYETFFESLQVLNNAPCYIDETPGLSMSEIRARARIFKQKEAKNGKCAIFVDYVQIVQPDRLNKTSDTKTIVSATSQSLTQMARELQCPVVALAQLSRDVASRQNKRPIMTDLRDSGQIEQDASIILFLYRDEEYNKDTKDAGITEVIFGKNRDGKNDTVKYFSDLSCMHYSEMGVMGEAF